jgi:hypothetical protein
MDYSPFLFINQYFSYYSSDVQLNVHTRNDLIAAHMTYANNIALGQGVLIAICFTLPYSVKAVSIVASRLENG